MAFIRRKGKTRFQYLPMTASTVATKGSIMTLSSGLLVVSTSSTAPVLMEGVIRHTIASTDSDYATSGRMVEVETPLEKGVVWEGDTASLVTTDIGVEVDLTDGGTVNRGASSVKVAKAVGVISATKGLFYLKLNFGY